MRKLFFTTILLGFIPSAVMAASAPISRSQLNGNWPLTVSSGTLNCEQFPSTLGVRLGLITFTSNGRIYALNGIASGQAERRGWRQIEEIWKDNPAIPGTKVNIGPLLDRGLALCE